MTTVSDLLERFRPKRVRYHKAPTTRMTWWEKYRQINQTWKRKRRKLNVLAKDSRRRNR